MKELSPILVMVLMIFSGLGALAWLFIRGHKNRIRGNYTSQGAFEKSSSPTQDQASQTK